MKRISLVIVFMICVCSVVNASHIRYSEKVCYVLRGNVSAVHGEADDKRIRYLTDHFDEILNEANENFTFQGKPIHPGLVKEFSSWISDVGDSTTVTVDVSARHRNEYSESDVEARDGGIIFAEFDEGGYFSYKHLGRLSNGLHVLSVSDSGGGSGVFKELFFVEFTKGTAYSDEGVKYPRLLMSILRSYGLGDRDDGEIKIQDNSVVVGISKYRENPALLQFE